MKHKSRHICLLLLPVLTLSACTMRTDVEVEKVEQEKPKPQVPSENDKSYINELKNQEGFYRNELNESLEKANYMGWNGEVSEWAKYLNSLNKLYASLNKDTGEKQILNVIANDVWFVMAEHQLMKFGNINNGVVFEGNIEDTKLFNNALDNSFLKAKEAKFTGTKTEWKQYIENHTLSLDNEIKVMNRIDQIKSVAALQVWNSVEGHTLAVDALFNSFEQAKANGFKGSIKDWLLYLKKNSENKPSGKSNSPEDGNASVNNVAAGFIGAMLWNSLFNSGSTANHNNYYSNSGISRDGKNNMSGFYAGAAASSRASTGRSSSLSGYSVTRGGFGAAHGSASSGG